MRTSSTLALAVLLVASAANVRGQPAPSSPPIAVGPQYDTTHVYVAPKDFDRFVASVVATFGGTTSKQGVFTVTPTPSSTMSQLILTPVGTVSVFGFKTPVPHPFGTERTGYLVTDLDAAIRAARGDLIYFLDDDSVPPPALPDWSPVRRFGGYAAPADRKRSRTTAAMRRTVSVSGHAHAGRVHDFTCLWGALGCACWAV